MIFIFTTVDLTCGQEVEELERAVDDHALAHHARRVAYLHAEEAREQLVQLDHVQVVGIEHGRVFVAAAGVGCCFAFGRHNEHGQLVERVHELVEEERTCLLELVVTRCARRRLGRVASVAFVVVVVVGRVQLAVGELLIGHVELVVCGDQRADQPVEARPHFGHFVPFVIGAVICSYCCCCCSLLLALVARVHLVMIGRMVC